MPRNGKEGASIGYRRDDGGGGGKRELGVEEWLTEAVVGLYSGPMVRMGVGDGCSLGHI